MASFTPRKDRHGLTRWRVQVRRKGVVQSRTFGSKSRAKEWALEVEAGITGERIPRHTLGEAFTRFSSEESPKRKGARWEKVRLAKLGRDRIALLPLASVTEDTIAAWRNARLLEVSGSSVAREMGLISAVLEVARREWKWIKLNPCSEVRRPRQPPARRRGVADGEIHALGVRLVGKIGNQVFQAFRLAIETGMRKGEILSLTRDQIDLVNAVAHLEHTKNGDSRDVALSPLAIEILREVGQFTVSSASMDTLFRKARDAAGLHDLHFHDSRSEAVTRLSKKLDVLELARQIGHRNLSSLLLYYSPSAADRAKKLV